MKNAFKTLWVVIAQMLAVISDVVGIASDVARAGRQSSKLFLAESSHELSAALNAMDMTPEQLEDLINPPAK